MGKEGIAFILDISYGKFCYGSGRSFLAGIAFIFQRNM
jgi:hypothetical protein